MGRQLEMFAGERDADDRLNDAQAAMRRNADARSKTRPRSNSTSCACEIDWMRLARDLGLTEEFVERYRRRRRRSSRAAVA